MIKYLIMMLITPGICLAQAKVQIKPQVPEGSPPGLVCYDEASQKKLDDTQKVGMECLVKLKKTEDDLTALRKEQNAAVNFKAAEYVKPKFFEKPIVQMVIVGFFSIGLGVGVGLAL